MFSCSQDWPIQFDWKIIGNLASLEICFVATCSHAVKIDLFNLTERLLATWQALPGCQIYILTCPDVKYFPAAMINLRIPTGSESRYASGSISASCKNKHIKTKDELIELLSTLQVWMNSCNQGSASVSLFPNTLHGVSVDSVGVLQPVWCLTILRNWCQCISYYLVLSLPIAVGLPLLFAICHFFTKAFFKGRDFW